MWKCDLSVTKTPRDLSSARSALSPIRMIFSLYGLYAQGPLGFAKVKLDLLPTQEEDVRRRDGWPVWCDENVYVCKCVYMCWTTLDSAASCYGSSGAIQLHVLSRSRRPGEGVRARRIHGTVFAESDGTVVISCTRVAMTDKPVVSSCKPVDRAGLGLWHCAIAKSRLVDGLDMWQRSTAP